MTEPLPKHEFDRIFRRVPRLTVEVLIAKDDQGVLLALRDVDPCREVVGYIEYPSHYENGLDRPGWCFAPA